MYVDQSIHKHIHMHVYVHVFFLNMRRVQVLVYVVQHTHKLIHIHAYVCVQSLSCVFKNMRRLQVVKECVMYVCKSTCFMMTYALHVVNIGRFCTTGVNILLFTIDI